jgi:hypothetical protein
MKKITLLLVAVLYMLEFTASQSDWTLTKIALEGGSMARGRIRADIISTVTNATNTTSVCGTVNFDTAFSLCTFLDYTVAADRGTVSSFNLPSSDKDPLISNLNCDGVSELSMCTFSLDVTNCTKSNEAAISCVLTPGEVAGIVVGAVAFFLILVLIPVLICCCCCCGFCACLKGYKKI